jgi:Ca2+-binding RTX toxin-like protein
MKAYYEKSDLSSKVVAISGAASIYAVKGVTPADFAGVKFQLAPGATADLSKLGAVAAANVKVALAGNAADYTSSIDENGFVTFLLDGKVIATIPAPDATATTASLVTVDFADKVDAVITVAAAGAADFTATTAPAPITTGTLIVPDTTAPVYKSAAVSVDGLSLVLTYDEPLNSATAPVSAYAVTIDSVAVVPSAASVDGKTVVLKLQNAVTTGQVVKVAYTAPVVDATVADAAVQDTAGNNALAFTVKTAANGSTVPPDTIAPTFDNAVVSEDGKTITLTFNEPLNPKTAAPSTFAITLDGAATAVAPSKVDVSGSTVVLTLSKTVAVGQDVTIAYNAPAANVLKTNAAVQDLAGNDAALVAAGTVVTNNSIVDLKAPKLLTAEVADNGLSIVLTYDEALAATKPAISAYTVKAGATDATTIVTVTDVAVDSVNSTVTLTLKSPIAVDQKAVTIDYTVASTDADADVNTPVIGNAAVQDAAGNDTAALSSFVVTNSSTVPGAVTLTAGSTPSDSLVLTGSDDTLNAIVSATAGASTLDSTDKIDGAGNTTFGDSLNVTMTNANFAGFTTGSMKRIENVNLTTTGNVAFSAKTGATGPTDVKKFSIDGTNSTTGVEISDLSVTTPVAIELSNQASGALKVGYLTSTGTAKTLFADSEKQSLTVTNVGAAATPIDVNVPKVTAFNVVSSGTTNVLNLTNAVDAKAISVSGAATTTLTAIPATTTSLDASALTGNLTATVSANSTAARTITVKGGTGASDTLTINSSTAAQMEPTMSGIETLQLATTTGGLQVTETNISGLKNLTLSKGLTGDVRVAVVADAVPTIKDLTIQANGASDKAMSVDAAGLTTLNYVADSATTGTDTNSSSFTLNKSEKLAVNVGTKIVVPATTTIMASKATDVTLNVSSGSQFYGTISAINATSFAVASDATFGGKLTVSNATTGSITSTSSIDTSVTLDATKLKTLTVKSTPNLTLSGSTLTALSTLTAEDLGKTLTLPELPAAGTIKVSGNTGSAAVFSTIGNDANVNPVSLTASSLMTLTTGNITSKDNVTVDVSALFSRATIGTITSSKTADINASGSGQAVTITGIVGDKVIVNAKSAQSFTQLANGITAGSAVTYTGMELSANTLAITGSATSTALDVTYTGGNAADTLTVNAGAAQTKVTVKGDLGIGTNAVTVDLTKATAGVAVDAAAVLNSAVTVTGGAGNDTITGSSSADSISAGAGNDALTGGAGNDTFVVTESVATAIDTITDFGNGVDSISGSTAGTLNVTITDASATKLDVSANAAKASITGGAAADTIIGGAGADTISGGAGNDTITVGDGLNVINVTAGTDTITDLGDTDKLSVSATATASATIAAAWTAAAAENAGAIVITTPGFKVDLGLETGTGTAKITNTGAAASLTGGLGADTITAGVLGDTISGGAGSDSIVGGSGADSITGGLGNDTITAGAGIDDITVGSTVTGADASTDTITDLGLGGTADKLTVNAGATAIATVTGNWAAATATNAGTIQITTSGYTVDMTNVSGAGTTTITNIGAATTAATTLTGSSGADTITGGAGNDIITGGKGVDSLKGNGGDDTFLFSTDGSVMPTVVTAAGFDVISDFNSGDSVKFAATVTLPDVDSTTLAASTAATPNVNVNSLGMITFAATDTTFAQKVAAIEADAGLDAAGQVALFTDSGASYIYYSGAAIGNTDDQFVAVSGTGSSSSNGLFVKTDGSITSVNATPYTAAGFVTALTFADGVAGALPIAKATSISDTAANITLQMATIGTATNAAKFSNLATSDTSSISMTTAQADAIKAITGTKNVTLTTAAGTSATVTQDLGSVFGTVTLANATNFVTQGAIAQIIMGGTGDDTVVAKTGVTSTSNLGAGTNVVIVPNAGNISAGTFTASAATTAVPNPLGYNVDAAATGTLSSTQAALITSAVGTQSITLSNAAGTAALPLTLNSAVETFTLAGSSSTVAATNFVTLGAATLPQTVVVSSSGSDTINLSSAVIANTVIAGLSTVTATSSVPAATDTLVTTNGTNIAAMKFGSAAAPVVGTVTGAETLNFTGGVTLTSAQLAGFKALTGSTTPAITGTGTAAAPQFAAVAPNLTLTDAISATTLNTVVFKTDSTTVTLANVAGNAITSANATVEGTKTLIVNGSALTGTNTLNFNGTAEADGKFNITGGAGDDTIVGGAGVDTISGGAGNDSLTGGTGADTFTVASNSTVVGSSGGVDTITDWAAGDTLSIGVNSTANVAINATTDFTSVTNAGTLAITAGTAAPAMTITGSTGADLISGGAGSDSIVGGAGVDTLDGGAGVDTFDFRTADSLSNSSTGTVVTTIDTISNFATDFIKFGTAPVVRGTSTATTLAVNATSGLTTFTSANTYGDKLAAIQADTTGLAAVGKASLFVHDTDSYVYYSGAALGTSDDQVIKLAGVIPDTVTVASNSISVSDTTAPTVRTISIASATGIANSTLNAGDVVSVTVPFSEPVTVTGVPQLALTIGTTVVQAAYSAGSGTNSLTFTYTILATQTDADGISVVGTTALGLNSGTIKDAAGNSATLTTVAVVDNASYKVDTTVPTAPTVPAGKTGATGADILTKGVNTTEAAGNIVFTAALGTSGAVAGDTIELFIDGATPLTHVLTAGEVIATSYDFTVAGSALGVTGTKSLTTKVTDVAGNAGAASTGLSVVVDKTAPTTTVATLTVADNVGTITGNLTTGGVTDDTALVVNGTLGTAILGEGEVIAVYDGVTRLGAATITSNTVGGAWTYADARTLTNAQAISYTARAEDTAGNQGTATTAFTTTVDTTAPTNASTVLAAASSVVAGATVAIASAAETNGAVWLAPAGTTTFAAGATMTTATGTATSILAPTTPATDYKLFVIDAAGNVSSPSTAAVTVTGSDTTAPAFASATVNGTSLVMTYTEATTLDAVNKALPAAFTVLGNTVSAVAVDAALKTVTLTLGTAVVSGTTVTVGYTDPTTGNDIAAIQDAAGNDAATITAQSVTNNTAVVGAFTNSSLDGVGSVSLAAVPLVLANTGAVNYTDNVATANNVTIANFGADDKITITGGTLANYNSVISTDGSNNVVINYNNGAGVLNTITLTGLTSPVVYDVTSFNAMSVGDLFFV